MLFCFSYDPSTGRYSTFVLTLVRVGGVLTVLAFALFLFRVQRRERAARRAEPPPPAATVRP
jgi:protein SCO1/2